MSSTIYPTLEAVLQDPLFPDVDVGLRSGRHYSLDGDIREYEFLQTAHEYIEALYKRYGCRLLHGPESYYYLLSDGLLLGSRHMTVAEMLVGQTLALMRMDPAFLVRNGRIPEEKLIAMMEHLVGQERLLAFLAPRTRGRDRGTDARKVRDEVEKALHSLQRLGLVRRIVDGDERLVLPRPAIMRFAEAVRDASDPSEALKRLVARGEARIAQPPDTEDDA